MIRANRFARIALRIARATKNGGVGSVVVGFRGFWGAPIFRLPNPLKYVLWDLWTENRGAPKARNPTTTDPTPHFRLEDETFEGNAPRRTGCEGTS